MSSTAQEPRPGESVPPSGVPGEATPGAGDDRNVGYLGIVADDRTTRGRGVRVTDVVPDGPGQRAGLQRGDLVTGIDGQATRSMQDLARVMYESPPGTELRFQVQRGSETIETTVRLGNRPPAGQRRFQEFGQIPESAGGQTMRPRTLLGVRTVPVTAEAQRFYGLPPGTRGALVTEVLAGSPAAKAGVPMDAVIVSVDRRAADGPDGLAQLIDQAGAGTEVQLDFYYRGQLEGRTVRLEDFVPNLPAGVSQPAQPSEGAPLGLAPPGVEEAAEGVGVVDRLNQRIAELEHRIMELERQFEELMGQRPQQ